MVNIIVSRDDQTAAVLAEAIADASNSIDTRVFENVGCALTPFDNLDLDISEQIKNGTLEVSYGEAGSRGGRGRTSVMRDNDVAVACSEDDGKYAYTGYKTRITLSNKICSLLKVNAGKFVAIGKTSKNTRVLVLSFAKQARGVPVRTLSKVSGSENLYFQDGKILRERMNIQACQVLKRDFVRQELTILLPDDAVTFLDS